MRHPARSPFNFTVSLDGALANPISVDYDAVDDTATVADNDYGATSPLARSGCLPAGSWAAPTVGLEAGRSLRRVNEGRRQN